MRLYDSGSSFATLLSHSRTIGNSNSGRSDLATTRSTTQFGRVAGSAKETVCAIVDRIRMAVGAQMWGTLVQAWMYTVVVEQWRAIKIEGETYKRKSLPITYCIKLKQFAAIFKVHI